MSPLSRTTAQTAGSSASPPVSKPSQSAAPAQLPPDEEEPLDDELPPEEDEEPPEEDEPPDEDELPPEDDELPLDEDELPDEEDEPPDDEPPPDDDAPPDDEPPGLTSSSASPPQASRPHAATASAHGTLRSTAACPARDTQLQPIRAVPSATSSNQSVFGGPP